MVGWLCSNPQTEERGALGSVPYMFRCYCAPNTSRLYPISPYLPTLYPYPSDSASSDMPPPSKYCPPTHPPHSAYNTPGNPYLPFPCVHYLLWKNLLQIRYTIEALATIRVHHQQRTTCLPPPCCAPTQLTAIWCLTPILLITTDSARHPRAWDIALLDLCSW